MSQRFVAADAVTDLPSVKIDSSGAKYMENNTTTHRWSAIEGLAAVAIETGKKVGIVDDFLFDPKTGVIRALQIKTGLFGHRLLPAEAVNGLGEHAVTFTSEDVILKENADKDLNMLPLGKELQNYRVLSEGGTLIGTIRNILIESPTTGGMRIAALELGGGLRERFTGHYPKFEASQVTHYGRDVVVISDAVAQSLQQ